MRLSFLLLISLMLHATLIAGWQRDGWRAPDASGPIEIRIVTQAPEVSPVVRHERATAPKALPRRSESPVSPISPEAAPRRPGKPASLAAPPPPSAGEWQLASTYTLKNSKRYRHNWGQQVRSMMGTAVEGPEQGMVRFRIEIAPDGTLAHVTELWSTSKTASERAWRAIKSLPPLPPTPTGKPLIFERTISFMPYETGWPPSYTLDCLPDPPAFKNPFAWDGASPPSPVQRQAPKPADAEQVQCETDSTAETIEQEEGEMKRQLEVYRWGR